MGTWLRHINTQQERRLWAKFVDLRSEYPELKIRNGRSQASLPTCWDDIHRRDYYDRSWKRFREQQYRVKKPKMVKLERSKIVYDTFWVCKGHCYRWNLKFLRYRVREAYRRHEWTDKGTEKR